MLKEKKEKEEMAVIAVSSKEFNEFGCPYCGYQSGNSPVSGYGAAAWVCGDCGETCCILAEGLTKPKFSFGDVFPELQAHPRRGIPKHGDSDIRPEGIDAEFFQSRGTGIDITPGCFVCGGNSSFYDNIAAFVKCKEAGERVVKMFPTGARLDYREYEPDYVQVKIGACEAHVPNLEKLNQLVKDGLITADRIEEAKA